MKIVFVVLLIVNILLCGCSNKNGNTKVGSSSTLVESENTQIGSSSTVGESDTISITKEELSILPEIFEESFDEEQNLSEDFIIEYVNDGNSDRTTYMRTLRQQEWYYGNNIVSGPNVTQQIIVKGEYKDALPPINNSLKLTNILGECSLSWLGRGIDSSLMGVTDYPNWGVDNVNVNFLRWVEDGKYYTVNKLQNGGWVYTFYEPFPHGMDSYDACDDPTCLRRSGSVYAEKTLSIENFESISEGCTINDVALIDSAVNTYRIIYESNSIAANSERSKEYLKNYMESIHLLTDGILQIQYRKIDNDWVVDSMVYSEDYTYTSSFYKWSLAQFDMQTKDFHNKQFKILPQDYPPAS